MFIYVNFYTDQKLNIFKYFHFIVTKHLNVCSVFTPYEVSVEKKNTTLTAPIHPCKREVNGRKGFCFMTAK